MKKIILYSKSLVESMFLQLPPYRRGRGERLLLLLLLIIVPALCFAQPSPVKKAAKNMFKLTTFSEDGNILHTGYGVFVAADGTCLSNWEPFIGASSANIIDCNGRKYDVDCLVGANEIYNVAKFRVIVPKEKKMQIVPLTIAESQIAAGGQCWLIEYDVKAPGMKKYAPTTVETFATSLPYYIFEQTAAEELAGSPFLNDAGELMGLMQPAKRRTDIYCPSAQYGMTLSTSGLTANEPTIRQTSMRIALPNEYSQAALAMMMASGHFSSPNYLATANEFITLFPDKNDGYVAKADYLAATGDYEGSAAAIKEGIEKVETKADMHHSFSKIIYNKMLYNTDSTFTAWTLDNALAEADEAINLDPQPIYKMQKAKTLYVMKKFDDAYQCFYDLKDTPMRSGETFYYAALSKENAGAPVEEVEVLMDSMVACYGQPYRNEAAPYLLIRGKWLDEKGKSRKAIADFNAYEELLKQNVNATFYYTREQVELRAKMYQLALNDIDKAIEKEPREAMYLAEKALLLVRVNYLDDAIKTSEETERLFPQYGDGYAIHGLALILKKKKTEGMQLLNKAKELDSPLADQFIEKYQ